MTTFFEKRWFRIAGMAMVAFILLSFLLPLFSPFFGSNPDSGQPDAGLAPQVADFVLPSTTGLSVRLSDTVQSHTATILIFHRGRGCPTCRDQLRAIQANYSALQREGADVVAVSDDIQEDAELMAERVGASFAMLYDASLVVHNVYGLTEQMASDITIAFFLVDRDLRLIVDPIGISGEQTLPVDVLLQTIREANGSASTTS